MTSAEATYIDVSVPKNSREVVVTSILSPYNIRVQGKPLSIKTRELLSVKLRKIVEPIVRNNSNENYKPAIGDDVIIIENYKTNVHVDLPDMLCRGVIMDTTSNTSNVFLLDDGITMNVPTESLIKYSRDTVPVDALSYTIGIYNILPASWSDELQICKQWPKTTTEFIKQMIEVSSKTYFHALSHDREKNIFFGDLFLVLENKNVSLKKLLLHTYLAIPLNDDLLKSLENDLEHSTVQLEVNQNETSSNQDFSFQKSVKDPFLQEERKAHKSHKHETNEKILIKGKYSIKPLDHIENARFTTTVHETLKNQGVRMLKEIQCYMWPAIKKNHHCIAIGHKKSGKTTGYIVPIISEIAENEEIIVRKQKNEKITKPCLLILCKSVDKCTEVATKCNDILYYHKDIKVFAGYDGIDDKKVMTHLCNKFHILVATVPFLMRTIENYSDKLHLSELSYLVLDDADLLLSNFTPQIMTLMKKLKILDSTSQSNINDEPMIQIITVSETWTDQIKLFVELWVKDPYICIASYIEAAAFCRVQGRMIIRHSEKKKEEVLLAVNDHTKVKTMIFCLNSNEAIELNDYLESNSIKTILAHEKTPITKIQEIRDDWAKYLSGMYPVLICTDSVLSDLEISDVQLLIHYSVTHNSKTQFTRRFSVLMDNWKVEMKQYPCRILIIFDETKECSHFKGVIAILKRLKVNLPNDWSLIAEGLDVANNINKKNFPLCSSIMLFGKCEVISCPYRHRIFNEVDRPKLKDISVGDEIKLMILSVHNAGHFSARIFECIKTDPLTREKNKITFNHDKLTLSKNLNKYYSEPKNRRLPSDLRVGQICGYKSQDNQYVRVQILNFVELDVRTDKPKYVQLRCIDDGSIREKLSINDLLEIPEELLNYTLPIIDIYLMGLVPPDLENKWSNVANKVSNNWTKENKNDKSYAYAKVLLHLGNSIWTDSLEFRTKVTGFPDLISPSINSILKDKNLAIKNESHHSVLLSLCENAELPAGNNNSSETSE